MPHVDILFGQVQSREVTSVKVHHSLSGFVTAVQKIREDIDKEPVVGVKRRCYENKLADAKEVCDVFLLQCRERFKFTGHLEASRLLYLNNASQYTRVFPERALAHCTAAYPMLDNKKLRTELGVLYCRPDLHKSGLVELLALVSSDGLNSTFSEVVKLLKILVTTPMTTAEAERCFSTLKRIKTFLRSTITNERLSALAMISTESQMINEMKEFNENVIDHFARAKKRRMEFIFK